MKKILTVMAVCAAFMSNAHAAKFGVKVVSESGEPLAGIAVCVGTHGNYKQYGAVFTSSTGEVMVEVPNVPLIVTISKNRFTAMRMSEPARKFNLIKQVKLKDGVPGPRCRAGSTLVRKKANYGDHKYAVTIDDVYVRNSAFKVMLEPSVTGEPSHYRVAQSDSFKGSDWKSFTSDIQLDGSLIHSPNVFLQLRKYKSLGDGWVEARSNVLSVPISN